MLWVLDFAETHNRTVCKKGIQCDGSFPGPTDYKHNESMWHCDAHVTYLCQGFPWTIKVRQWDTASSRISSPPICVVYFFAKNVAHATFFIWRLLPCLMQYNVCTRMVLASVCKEYSEWKQGNTKYRKRECNIEIADSRNKFPSGHLQLNNQHSCFDRTLKMKIKNNHLSFQSQVQPFIVCGFLLLITLQTVCMGGVHNKLGI